MHVLLCNTGCWLVHSRLKYIYFLLILKLNVMYGVLILHVEPISTLLNVFLHEDTYCFVKGEVAQRTQPMDNNWTDTNV